MALTISTFRSGWQRLRNGVCQAGRMGARVQVSGARAIGRSLADLLFPPSCVCCAAELDERLTAGGDVHLCEDCLNEMELFSGSTCTRCGAPVPGGTARKQDLAQDLQAATGCYRCRGPKLWFDQTVALGPYEGALRDIVLRMKNSAGDSLSLTMGRLLVAEWAARLVEIDVVVPIPSHWRRRVVHHTNSAAVLAEVIAKRVRAPLAERLLRRSRYTVRQSDLSPTDRWKNVRRAFSVRGGYHLNQARVLLVDDVLTTGATCSEAARALRQAGAESVTVAVIARAVS